MITEKQIKDAMQYSSWSEETLTVAGYTIKIEQDQDCENPYESDSMSPALWLSLDRHGDLKEYGNESLESFFDRVTHDWISRNWRKICSALNWSESEHDIEARDHASYYKMPLGEARFDKFSDYLGEMRAESWGCGIDYLNALRALYRLAGIPAETYNRHGYSQGDSVYGLIVMTPAWAECVGAPHATMATIDKAESDMSGQADQYGAWVWGDCYGYSITRDGEAVDSCWGFVGSDPEESGMLENILYAINADIQHRRTERLAKVKAFVKARVPLMIRALNLDSFPC